MNIELGLLETLVVALFILFLGYFLNEKIPVLKDNNIPEPVVGGIAFSLLSALLHTQFALDIRFDMSMKTPLMILFFTTVGLGASVSLLVKGGPKVAIFMCVATLYLIFQNVVGVSLAMFTDMNPLMGLMLGSVTLSGGHGNGATYAELFSTHYNLQNALELAMASATFGLVLGGLLGGPVAKRLIQRHNLTPTERPTAAHEVITYDPEEKDLVTPKKMMETLVLLATCMVTGKYIHTLLQDLSVPLPAFLLPLLVGILLTNLCEFSGKYKISKVCLDLWGTMALSIFLAMAMMSLRIWELVALAGPMLMIILMQTLMMAFFAYFITFRLMGKNYDAAIMAGGHCGFGMGATPTAVANMESLVSRFGPSPQAFLVVPMVGAFFIDISNALVLQLFMSFSFIL